MNLAIISLTLALETVTGKNPLFCERGLVGNLGYNNLPSLSVLMWPFVHQSKREDEHMGELRVNCPCQDSNLRHMGL